MEDEEGFEGDFGFGLDDDVADHLELSEGSIDEESDTLVGVTAPRSLPATPAFRPSPSPSPRSLPSAPSVVKPFVPVPNPVPFRPANSAILAKPPAAFQPSSKPLPTRLAPPPFTPLSKPPTAGPLATSTPKPTPTTPKPAPAFSPKPVPPPQKPAVTTKPTPTPQLTVKTPKPAPTIPKPSPTPKFVPAPTVSAPKAAVQKYEPAAKKQRTEPPVEPAIYDLTVPPEERPAPILPNTNVVEVEQPIHGTPSKSTQHDSAPPSPSRQITDYFSPKTPSSPKRKLPEVQSPMLGSSQKRKQQFRMYDDIGPDMDYSNSTISKDTFEATIANALSQTSPRKKEKPAPKQAGVKKLTFEDLGNDEPTKRLMVPLEATVNPFFEAATQQTQFTPAVPEKKTIPGPAGDIMFIASITNDKKRSSVITEIGMQGRTQSPVVFKGPKKPVEEETVNVSELVDFYRGPWLCMLEQLDLPPFLTTTTPGSLLKYNIKYIMTHGFYNKVPKLAVVVKSIRTDINASVTLKDPTGEMEGTIHHKVLSEHSIKKGSVLLLTQLSVFNPNPSSPTHYLNITASNIQHIFPPDSRRPSKLKQLPNWRLYSPSDVYCKPEDVMPSTAPSTPFSLSSSNSSSQSRIAPMNSSQRSISPTPTPVGSQAQQQRRPPSSQHLQPPSSQPRQQQQATPQYRPASLPQQRMNVNTPGQASPYVQSKPKPKPKPQPPYQQQQQRAVPSQPSKPAPQQSRHQQSQQQQQQLPQQQQPNAVEDEFADYDLVFASIDEEALLGGRRN